MPIIKLDTILPAFQTIKSVTSPQGDMISINVVGKDLTLHCYDKAREIRIFGKFPNTCDDDGNLKFSVSLERLRTLLRGQTKIKLEFGKEGLKYLGKSIQGTLEAGQGEKISYPDLVDDTDLSMNKIIYEWIKLIKLNTLFKKEDMMVFLKHDSETKEVCISCADNFHAALLRTTYPQRAKVTFKSFDLAIPVRYIEIANKIMVEEGVVIAVKDDNMLFYNENLVLQVPKINIDAEQVNIASILEFVAGAKGETAKKFSLQVPKKIKTFLVQSQSICEDDRDNKVEVTLKDGTLTLFTETKHGRIKMSQGTASNKKGSLIVTSKALSDIVSKIQDEEENLTCFLSDTTLYMRSKRKDYTIELVTLGINNET